MDISDSNLQKKGCVINLIYALAQRDENIASYDFALSQVDVDYSGWEEYIDTNIR